ncbi:MULTISPECIES: AarF/ABC1/UbiB kinase family protein [unclassified Moorena]|nr:MULTISPECIES: AarF/ABC1/UbiB kinase family protein [unclassified Moorena]NEP33401.1 AarF/ABC1/UbiB kinase family protein [Moorena sp. SIO3B2]NEQ16316.1 AarF/ABC1/UbiB kinase family protein [Moorena sp. SIO3E2]NEP67907.1 AarF/ABC1/UbiB kinase family protein [Moorena sp. SIO3A5]NEQ09911.1 AarF/ABC1/UbiB kinase family protein [Moorena sp. SIO4E2]NER90037.1 AarF/ABC1/UbiB kinase family protein [Moorena sp. SIO3A2]
MFSLTQTSTRQREILEVVFRNGWDYMRGLLTGNKNNDEPQLPTPAVLRNILIDLGPVYVKLGQLLSTRPDLLPGAYVEVLTDLQANVPAVAWSEIESLLQQELAKPISETFTTINPQAIAAGSIGQVHRATLKNGQEVALKVQRPGIDQIVAQDIAIIRGLAELVSLTEFGKTYDIVVIADEFVTALEAELDFTQEANYTDKLRSNLSNSRWFDSQQLVIPKIYWDLTSQKLLTIEWLEGAPLLSAQLSQTQEGKDPQTQRREITTLLFRAFFQQVYIDGFFHADPHPGNIFYLRDGRVALLDCGMIGRLDPRSQQILTEMLLAIVDLDGKRCAQLTLQLSEAGESVNLSGLENDYDRMLRKYYNRSLSKINFSEVFYEILQVSRNNKIRLPGNMGLYAKTLANLEGVTRGFYPDINLLDQIKPLITEVFRRQLLGDDPLQTLLRTILDLKSLSLRSPSQIELFLNRVSSETLKWNITVPELDKLRYSIDDSANRLSFSIVVGSLIIGAAIVASGSQTPQMLVVTNILFAAASFLGLWLIVSILRSGRLR